MKIGVSQLGKSVAEYRRRAKLTAEELADRAGAGLTRSVIANLESGRKQDLTTAQLLAVALTLEVSPMLLMFDLRDPYGRVVLRSGEPDVTATTWLAAAWWAGDVPSWEMDIEGDEGLRNQQWPSETPDGNMYLLHRRNQILEDLAELGGELRSLPSGRSGESERAQALARADEALRTELRGLEADLRSRGVDLSKPHVGPDVHIETRG